MALLGHVDLWFAWASSLCVQPVGIAIQLQGCVICLALALGWAFAASVRGKELKKIQKAERLGNSFAFLYPDINNLEHSVQEKLPRVTVIMPVKGFSEHSLSNWESQVISLYGGPVEFFFVVESKDDPAYEAVSYLLHDLQGQVDAKLIIAGLSSTCSQKIHNQLIFVLTGYPFDIPSGSIGSYCMYEYHMPCSMGFATGGRTFFLWGGCMMMHADDFRSDRYSMVTGLRNGGYSDDMTLAAVAGANKRIISSPPVAIFFHPLARHVSFAHYWNYLRKQTFVLESYNTNVNWWMNRALFSSHCWLSWSFVMPFLMAAVQLLAFVRYLFGSPFLGKDPNTIGAVLSCGLLLCSFIELLSLWNLSRVEIDLCNALSPEQEPVSIYSYNWFLIFWALIIDNFLYPISAIYSFWTQSIDWAGVRYHLHNGKIHKIERKACVRKNDFQALIRTSHISRSRESAVRRRGREKMRTMKDACKENETKTNCLSDIFKMIF